MNADRWLTVITTAAIAGLVILNYQGASELFKTLGGVAVNYVKVVQGR
jgi:hypothetical protein